MALRGLLYVPSAKVFFWSWIFFYTTLLIIDFYVYMSTEDDIAPYLNNLGVNVGRVSQSSTAKIPVRANALLNEDHNDVIDQEI